MNDGILLVCQLCGDESVNLMVSEQGTIIVFCAQSAHEILGLEADANLYKIIKEAQNK